MDEETPASQPTNDGAQDSDRGSEHITVRVEEWERFQNRLLDVETRLKQMETREPAPTPVPEPEPPPAPEVSPAVAAQPLVIESTPEPPPPPNKRQQQREKRKRRLLSKGSR